MLCLNLAKVEGDIADMDDVVAGWFKPYQTMKIMFNQGEISH